jgi:hypothetical protein
MAVPLLLEVLLQERPRAALSSHMDSRALSVSVLLLVALLEPMVGAVLQQVAGVESQAKQCHPGRMGEFSYG